MLGFVIGTLCLVGLIKTLRWGRHHGYGGCGGHGYGGGGGGGWGGRRWGGHHDHHARWGGGGGWGGGPTVMLHGLFRRLETTPGQEKVILAAIDEVREAARKARGEARSTRKDVAGAMRAPAFDEVLFGEMFGRHDAEMTELRKAVVGALAKVHDALDEKQRAQLADLIESGPGVFRL